MNTKKYWETIYEDAAASKLVGWYAESLDADVRLGIERFNLSQGTCLDIGSGHGTQAMALSKIGLEVTGIDISNHAIAYAKQSQASVEFLQDDILNTKLSTTFDLMVDRGCFHVFDAEKRATYIDAVTKLLKNNGFLLLKCFSEQQAVNPDGPFRFSIQKIDELFGAFFSIKEYWETAFIGTKEVPPKALFVILQKK